MPPTSEAVLHQLDAMKANIATQYSAKSPELLSIGQLGLTSADFYVSQLYPMLDVDESGKLSVDEWMAVIRFFEANWVPVLQMRDLPTFYRYFSALAMATYKAKQSLNGGTVGSQVFLRSLRPRTAYSGIDTTTSVHETWLASSVTAGWNSAYFNVNLNATTGSGANAINFTNNAAAMVIAVADLAASPKLFEYQWFDASNKPQGVSSHPAILIPGGSGILPSREIMFIDRGQSAKLDVNFASAGTSIPVLYGVEWVTPTIYTVE